MKSYLTHLECTSCGATHSADQLVRLCTECDKVLYARYDLDAARRETDRDSLEGRRSDMWRYFEMMPVLDETNIVSLGEGMTPVLEAPRLGEVIGAANLVIKDEGQNPTGTFKSRGLSAAVSKAKELGAAGVTIPTAGNAGGALGAYAARAGMEAHVFMPQDALDANKKEVTHAGGTLHLVDGLIGEAGQQSRELAAELGMFDLSTLQEPYRAEGKKTMGYEIAEQCGWTFPDTIIYPTGGGTGVVGIWKAIEELEALGWTDGKRPRFFCVQAEGCQPIVRAFERGDEHAEPWENAHTVAHGMRVPLSHCGLSHPPRPPRERRRRNRRLRRRPARPHAPHRPHRGHRRRPRGRRNRSSSPSPHRFRYPFPRRPYPPPQHGIGTEDAGTDVGTNNPPPV